MKSSLLHHLHVFRRLRRLHSSHLRYHVRPKKFIFYLRETTSWFRKFRNGNTPRPRHLNILDPNSPTQFAVVFNLNPRSCMKLVCCRCLILPHEIERPFSPQSFGISIKTVILGRTFIFECVTHQVIAWRHILCKGEATVVLDLSNFPKESVIFAPKCSFLEVAASGHPPISFSPNRIVLMTNVGGKWRFAYT